MYALGIDIGYSSVKLALMDEEQHVVDMDYQFHKGRIKEVLSNKIQFMLDKYGTDTIVQGAVTGSGEGILTRYKGIESVNEVTALVEGGLLTLPQVSSIIELGGQSAKYITHIGEKNTSGMSIAINSNCSAGTGSFLEEQIHRLALNIDDYSDYALRAKSIPRIAGRCSVFAKTDIIHHQQEGIPIEDVLLGLAYAVAKNYKATMIKKSDLEKPLLFLGGVAHNQGMVKALTEVLQINKADLIVPKYCHGISAIGAASMALKQKWRIHWEKVHASLHEKETPLTASKLQILAGHGVKESHGKHVLSAGDAKSSHSFLGIDIGSTSTNVVILNDNNQVMAYQYLKTLGNPMKAVEKAIDGLVVQLGEDHRISNIGVTGSGRHFIGNKLGATVIKDEITSQATATITLDPDIDTIIEIGGQDSKFITLQDGGVRDFKMNKICAAGTGAFIEEQANKLKIPLDIFGDKALSSTHPLDLGERCTVFIESSVMNHLANGANEEDIAAGLCYAVAKNYLHKVVGQKQLGNNISFQGGVAYNQGVINAFKTLTGKPIHVLPFFSVTGAFGVAKLASDAYKKGQEKISLQAILNKMRTSTVAKDTMVTRGSDPQGDYLNNLFFKGYTKELEPHKKTVGIPRVLFLHKLFPAFNTFFRELGYNTIFTDLSNEETVALSMEYGAQDTCYPVKLVHGHVAKLLKQGVDYIFLPSLLTMKHEISKSRHDYGCVYMQSISKLIESTMNLDKWGVKLLSPVLSFTFGKKYMMKTMLKIGEQLGKSKVATIMALQKGMKLLQMYMKETERIGQEKVNGLQPKERAFVIITRTYGIIDPILNMGVPEKLTQMGHKVLTLSHLPAHDVDLSKEYPNMYWPFGQHILSGAQIIKRHPNLYAIYLTNHGCGPDTVISKFFEDEMGDKPFLHIEVDEHASAVGVITRIEAFINSLDNPKRKAFQNLESISEKIQLKDYPSHIEHKKVNIIDDFSKLDVSHTLFLPYLYPYADIYQKVLEKKGMDVRVLPMSSYDSLKRGLAYTTTKETFSLTTTIGDICLQEDRNKIDNCQGTYMLPKTEGAEVQGQYNRVIRSVLDKEGRLSTVIFAPFMEDAMASRDGVESMMKVLIAGDLVGLAPHHKREQYLQHVRELMDESMLTVEAIEALCEKVKEDIRTFKHGKRILVVGEPLIVYHDYLNQYTINHLEEEGNRLVKCPLSEYMWALWSGNLKQPSRSSSKEVIKHVAWATNLLKHVHDSLEDVSPFVSDPEGLLDGNYVPIRHYVGAGGRYRYAKINADMSKYHGIITVASMYENTSTIMDILQKSHKRDEIRPILNLTFDGTVNEHMKTKLDSFMYYL